jgi:hypothetical protein
MQGLTMSLTSLLERKHIKERFLAEFLKPEFRGVKVPIKAPPLTAKYGLVGRAFDYLFRFYLQKLNPSARADRWVAEEGLEYLRAHKDPAYPKAKVMFKDAQARYKTFMAAPLQIPTRELADAAVILAHLECVFRTGELDPMIFDPSVPTAVLDDLEAMLALVPQEQFRARMRCVLNPTFSAFAAGAVGGADADLVLDDTLIDLKTNKDLVFGRDIFNQLVGYYALWRLGGITHCSRAPITHLGVYFARFGFLHRFPVSQCIVEERMPDFLKWFATCRAEGT